MGKRGCQELLIQPLGVQSFKKRVAKRQRLENQPPPVSFWRCNLTALSQVHNLYFVAYGEHIAVYVPQFPDQSLSSESELVITSEPSRPNLRGYMDRVHTHTINYLIVQHLGKEEVIAVVRDDGDVNLYLVRHVVQAIQRRADPAYSFGRNATDIRPFFQDNVGHSAWGLAIHTEARILATSSNAHEVRVFKFGLLPTKGGSLDDETGSPDNKGNKDKAKRETDVTHRIINGETNIPHISFCNTGDDPQAQWLLTTDINGVCRVMDLHVLEAVQTFRFGGNQSAQHGLFDRKKAGWIMLFLDRRSFQTRDSVSEALGLEADVSPFKHKDMSRVWDISKTIEKLPGAQEPFFVRRLTDTTERQRQTIPLSTTSREDARDSAGTTVHIRPGIDQDNAIALTSSDSDTEDDEGGVSLDVEERQGIPQGAQGDQSNPSRGNNDDDDYDDDDSDLGNPLPEIPDMTFQDDSRHERIVDESMYDAEEELILADPLAPAAESNSSSDDETVNSNIRTFEAGEGNWVTLRNFYFHNENSVRKNEPCFSNDDTGLCNDLPCPIIHASVQRLFLLQPSDQRHSTGSFCPPMVGLVSPFGQEIQVDHDFLLQFERLNMYAHIPPLGVIVVASQIGRALVLSLTKVPHSASSMAKQQSPSDRPTYAMQIECILPFVEQEKANERPFMPLHGIAASPMQGIKSNRWRLIMMYSDHSVLSYQIGRITSARDSAVEIESLVV